MKGAEHQHVALQEPLRARPQRAAVFRADGAGPNHVEVPWMSHRIVGSNFNTMSRETTSQPAASKALHRLGAAEKLQESRHF